MKNEKQKSITYRAGCTYRSYLCCTDLFYQCIQSCFRRNSGQDFRGTYHLPVFTPAAIPGLFIGCLLSNLLTGCMPLDVVFGSLATLIGACGTYALRKHKWLAPLPPIVANTIIVPFVLAYVYMAEGTIPFFMLTVGIGEVISCYVLGMILYKVLNNYRSVIFKNE